METVAAIVALVPELPLAATLLRCSPVISQISWADECPLPPKGGTPNLSLARFGGWRRITCMRCLSLFIWFTSAAFTLAEPATIHVFVAMVDNEHQDVQPVPAKIGNGEDLENNLYWG